MTNTSVSNRSQSYTHLRSFRATGQSMIPTIWDGDQVQLERTDHIHQGETLVYLEKNTLVAHRAIRMNEEVVWTRGDNQSDAPQAVPRTAVLGRVVSVTAPTSRWITMKRKLWVAFPSTMKLACQIKQRVLRTF